MSSDRRCPKCGSEMREGELSVNVLPSSSDQNVLTPFSYSTRSTFGIPPMVTEEGVAWIERTGQKKGWLVKTEETQTLKTSGFRCIECGYIELYAHK